jgi:hypothetical protein
MARISVFLAVQLVVLTFNAYACVLPLPQTSAMDCPSGTEEPVRGTCDAFLDIGPQSQFLSHSAANTSHMECALPVHLLLDTFVPLVRIIDPPRSTNTSIHLSIHTTILRV